MTKNIVTSFDECAQQNAARIAYDEMGTTTTYGKLATNANTLAAWLAKQDLAPQTPVLVFGDHQVEMIVSFLAALKTGHPYIPVSTDSALPRIQSILDTAQPGLIIAVDDFPSSKVTTNATVVSRDQLDTILKDPRDFTPAADQMVSGDELAYILFTSGTTGSPKGLKLATTTCGLSSIGCWAPTSNCRPRSTTSVNHRTRLTCLTCTGGRPC